MDDQNKAENGPLCECPCHSPNVLVTGVFSACCATPGQPLTSPGTTDTEAGR